MLRVVKTTGGVMLDPGQILPGRGAYVHDEPSCMELAMSRGGLARTLRSQVPCTLLTKPAAQAPSRSGNFRGIKDS